EGAQSAPMEIFLPLDRLRLGQRVIARLNQGSKTMLGQQAAFGSWWNSNSGTHGFVINRSGFRQSFELSFLFLRSVWFALRGNRQALLTNFRRCRGRRFRRRV